MSKYHVLLDECYYILFKFAFIVYKAMKKYLLHFLLLIITILFSSCANKSAMLTKSGLNPANFETEMQGKKTHLYTLTNKTGMEVCITNLGGRIVSLMAPNQDRSKLYDVVQGFDKVEDYLKRNNCHGAIVGRFANRIKDGRLPINGDTLYLPPNENGNTSHGGISPWHNRVFTPIFIAKNKLVLSLFSPEGEGGFPGAVTLKVIYTLTEENELDISYIATTTKPTVINVTNHSFFNLTGKLGESCGEDSLQIFADRYLGVDDENVADGSLISLDDSPLDFRYLHSLNDCYESQDSFIVAKKGIDLCYDLNKKAEFALAAIFSDANTGIKMRISTDQPGLWIFTSNSDKVQDYGKGNIPYHQHSGVAFETQHFPDAPNHPEWDSTLLNPGDTLRTHTTYAF